jgi:hypothetical protein
VFLAADVAIFDLAHYFVVSQCSIASHSGTMTERLLYEVLSTNCGSIVLAFCSPFFCWISELFFFLLPAFTLVSTPLLLLQVNLVGGYYDAGDNVKFGFPMAFTITMLSWSVIEYGSQMASQGQLGYSLEAIQWGTDYFIKAHPEPNVLYGEVGDGDSDHACWQRPEDMTTSRKAYALTPNDPGSDLAGETAAAMAAASIVFRSHGNPTYANELLNHAEQVTIHTSDAAAAPASLTFSSISLCHLLILCLLWFPLLPFCFLQQPICHLLISTFSGFRASFFLQQAMRHFLIFFSAFLASFLLPPVMFAPNRSSLESSEENLIHGIMSF